MRNMRTPHHLHNSAWADAMPAMLARGRNVAISRQLATAQWLLRRKADGRYLATANHSAEIQPLLPLSAAQQQALRQLLIATPRQHALSLAGLRHHLDALGIPADYGTAHQLMAIAEPTRLAHAGADRYQRPLWLLPNAATQWQAMRSAARAQGVTLEAISGFRSHAYQLGIFRRKLARGLSVAEILAVNAAPGFSEHHGGFAIDIGTPGEPPAETRFEHSAAFAWLCTHAETFGFHMSYPRDNPHGIVYEPWHWAYRAR
ncbi:MAG: peptidase [Gammaproteobacteria bacterium HGW-Gammaproteobacteria-6]|nr:MAG: peptidase [Gammaproteobacteria bacterium HGW-Gammaproteobacteria-6]